MFVVFFNQRWPLPSFFSISTVYLQDWQVNLAYGGIRTGDLSCLTRQQKQWRHNDCPWCTHCLIKFTINQRKPDCLSVRMARHLKSWPRHWKIIATSATDLIFSTDQDKRQSRKNRWKVNLGGDSIIRWSNKSWIGYPAWLGGLDQSWSCPSSVSFFPGLDCASVSVN